MKKSELRDKIKILVQKTYKANTERSWIAQVEGKKYYLLNLGEEEMAAESIARLLAYGAPTPAEGEVPAEETAEPPAEEEPAPEEETA